MITCDADLEYARAEMPAPLRRVLAGEASVVYATRPFNANTAYSFWCVMGNRAVALLDVRAAGFGIEAELTAKRLGKDARPLRMPISYQVRSRAQGRKLTWWNGLEALVLAPEQVHRRGGRPQARSLPGHRVPAVPAAPGVSGPDDAL